MAEALRENSDDKIEITTIICSMCPDKAKVVSFCYTCSCYLCKRCNMAHKHMICFKSHDVEVLENVTDDEETTEEVVQKGDVQSPTTSTSSSSSSVTDMLNYHQCLTKGKVMVNTITQVLLELKNNLTDMGKSRLAFIGCVNEMYEQYQAHLKKQRDAIIAVYEEDCSVRRETLVSCQEACQNDLKELLAKLAHVEKLSIVQAKKGGKGAGEVASLFSDDINVTLGYFNLLDIQFRGTFDDLNRSFDALSNLEPTNASNPLELLSDPLPYSTNHVKSMQIYLKFGQKGSGAGQFLSPHGLNLGFNQDIVVADSNNHRIQIFNKDGEFKFQFGLQGRQDGQLWYPRKVAILPQSKIYVVCDRGSQRSRMQWFTEDGTFLKKIPIHFIDIVAGLAVNAKEEIVLVDSVNATLYIFSNMGCSMRYFRIKEHVIEPSDIAVLGNEVFICDFKGHRIVVMDDTTGIVLRRFGTKATTNYPNGVDVTENGEVLIGDSHGNFFHVCVYSKDGEFMAEFRCPYVKVSRCCGLKVTTEGHIVTVDKNYHHVIVLDTIYLT